jgi:predicted nucleotidyltransferase
MLQKYNTYVILQEFFDKPTTSHQIRELSRSTKIGLPSVINHTNFLIKEGFLTKKQFGVYPALFANTDSEKYRLHKQQNMVMRMVDSGLLNLIVNKTLPSSIILFGSAARGEDTEASDLDLFVQAKEQHIDLARFEKQLNRKINILFEPDFRKLSKELGTNIINGIKLHGYLSLNR